MIRTTFSFSNTERLNRKIDNFKRKHPFYHPSSSTTYIETRQGVDITVIKVTWAFECPTERIVKSGKLKCPHCNYEANWKSFKEYIVLWYQEQFNYPFSGLLICPNCETINDEFKYCKEMPFLYKEFFTWLEYIKTVTTVCPSCDGELIRKKCDICGKLLIKGHNVLCKRNEFHLCGDN